MPNFPASAGSVRLSLFSARSGGLGLRLQARQEPVRDWLSHGEISAMNSTANSAI